MAMGCRRLAVPSFGPSSCGYSPRTLSHRREVPAYFLTEWDFKVIGKLYSFKGDSFGVICSYHLFVKHQLMKRSGSNALPKIGLAGLAAKKIHPVMKGKTTDQE
ncbi:Uncharacterized protein Fot_35967 [Forsythia ovata]|uniref:Uncharacterized protein n=1 Tax=Forsythia ovata TaxID=205694 RepID=A0ABD1SQT1_9LAMI